MFKREWLTFNRVVIVLFLILAFAVVISERKEKMARASCLSVAESTQRVYSDMPTEYEPEDYDGTIRSRSDFEYFYKDCVRRNGLAE